MNNQFTIRTIAVLLSALMLFGMLPVYAAEADDYICIEVENVTLDKAVNDAVDGYYTVAVPIVITQNSGFISSRFIVNHPESIELIGWENGEIFGESENLTPAVENNAIKNGIVVYYSNGTLLRNKTATGTLITLIYSVPDYVEAGDLDLTLKLMEIHKEDGVQSTLPEKINESCELVDGVISVAEKEEIEQDVGGDVTGDGRLDLRDLIRMLKYFGRVGVEMSGAGDVNGDGRLDRKDLTRLAQYFAGFDIQLY